MFGIVCINNVHGIGRVAQAHGGRRCEKLGIASKLKADDKDLVGKPLMKRIMQAWLPAHEVRGRMQLKCLGQLGSYFRECLGQLGLTSERSTDVPVAQVLHSVWYCISTKILQSAAFWHHTFARNLSGVDCMAAQWPMLICFCLP